MSQINAHRRALLCADEASRQHYEAAMQQAVAAVSAWLAQDKMYTGGSIRELRSQVAFQPAGQGMGLPAALARMQALFLEKSLKVHHPHSLAHLHCPTMVAAQAAEVLINAANQSMDSWDQSPVASLMEEQLIDWLRQKAGYGSGKAGVFTSGGTQSNLMGVLLARDACVAKHWQTSDGLPWSVQRDGLPPDALQRVKVVCSANAHFSVQKNMALMGMGFQSVVSVPVDGQGRMDTAALAQTLSRLADEGKIAACVVATAGTTDAGAIDDLREIRALSERAGAWMHVDAAWGGALLLSARYRSWLDGIELADSITLDFHKQFFQSISCGAFLLRRAEDYRYMHYEAEYLNSAYDEEHGVPNLVSKSLQTTRRFDALKLWLTIEAEGEALYASMIDHGIGLTRQVAEDIAADDHFELMMTPPFASVLFRVVPEGFPAPLLDDLNQNVADSLFARGEANIGVTKVGADKVLKMTLLNPVATVDDVRQLLAQVWAEAVAIQEAVAAGTYCPPVD